jgi:hypothetical protein
MYRHLTLTLSVSSPFPSVLCRLGLKMPSKKQGKDHEEDEGKQMQ